MKRAGFLILLLAFVSPSFAQELPYLEDAKATPTPPGTPPAIMNDGRIHVTIDEARASEASDRVCKEEDRIGSYLLKGRVTYRNIDIGAPFLSPGWPVATESGTIRAWVSAEGHGVLFELFFITPYYPGHIGRTVVNFFDGQWHNAYSYDNQSHRDTWFVKVDGDYQNGTIYFEACNGRDESYESILAEKYLGVRLSEPTGQRRSETSHIWTYVESGYVFSLDPATGDGFTWKRFLILTAVLAAVIVTLLIFGAEAAVIATLQAIYAAARKAIQAGSVYAVKKLWPRIKEGLKFLKRTWKDESGQLGRDRIQVRGGGSFRDWKSVKNIETIARGRGIREVERLIEKHGGRPQNWYKKKGFVELRGPNGQSMGVQEIHWYEHTGIGRIRMKRKL